MSKRKKPRAPAAPRDPVDLVDGIPDRSPRRGRWAYVAMAVIFLAWVGVLVYCHLAGNP